MIRRYICVGLAAVCMCALVFGGAPPVAASSSVQDGHEKGIRLESREIPIGDCITRLYNEGVWSITNRDELEAAVRNDASRARCLQLIGAIDWDRFTLLGAEFDAGWCDRPDGLSHEVRRDDTAREYVFSVRFGEAPVLCRHPAWYAAWVLAPKLPDGFTVRADVSTYPPPRLFPLVASQVGAEQAYIMRGTTAVEGEGTPVHEALIARYWVIESTDDAMRLGVQAFAVDAETLRPRVVRPWEGVLWIAPDGAHFEEGTPPDWTYVGGESLEWLAAWHIPTDQLPWWTPWVGDSWTGVDARDPFDFFGDGIHVESMQIDVTAVFRGWSEFETGQGFFPLVVEWLRGNMSGNLPRPGREDLELYIEMEGISSVWLSLDDFPAASESRTVNTTFLPGTEHEPAVVLSEVTIRPWNAPFQHFIYPLDPSSDTGVYTGGLAPDAWMGGPSWSMASGSYAPADLYFFDGRAGDRVRIRLSSDDFDAYLVLMNEDWDAVAEDDDSGGGFNAMIEAALPYTGRYFLQATSYDASGAGMYRLDVERLGPFGSGSADGRYEWDYVADGECDRRDSLGGTLLSAGEHVRATIDAVGAPGECSHLFHLYQFEGTAGDQAAAGLQSDFFSPRLYLLDEFGDIVDYDVDVRPGKSAVVFAELPYSGVYFISAGGVARGEVPAPYTLQLSVGEDLIGSCTRDELLEIQPGETHSEQWMDSSGAAWYCAQYDHIYWFEASAGERVVFSLETTGFDGRLALYDLDWELVAADVERRLPGVVTLEAVIPWADAYFITVISDAIGDQGGYDLSFHRNGWGASGDGAGAPDVMDLIYRLFDDDDDVRRQAKETLNYEPLGMREVPVLVEALDSHETAFAAQLLATIGADALRAVPRLLTMLVEGDDEEREMAAWALGNIAIDEPPVVEALLAALADDATFVRESAAFVLGWSGGRDPAVLSALVDLLTHDAESIVRGTAAFSLGLMAYESDDVAEFVPELITALADPDLAVVIEVIWALGVIGTSEALDALLELAQSDADVRLRHAAWEALQGNDFDDDGSLEIPDWSALDFSQCERSADPDRIPLRPGAPVTGALDASAFGADCHWVFDVHIVEGEAGESVVLTVSLDGMAAMLGIEDEVGVVDYSTSRGPEGRVELRVVLPRTGSYSVLVGGLLGSINALSPASYELTYSTLGAAGPAGTVGP